MSNRRNQNNIRGPHSALTDFLAANNISARQIRDNYERRQREAAEVEAQERGENGNGVDEQEQEEMDIDEMDAIIERARQEREAERRLDKKGKKNKKGGKKKKGKKRGSDDDVDGDGSGDSDFLAIPYKKVKKMPGQFANCEICEKRFTVTPYSKTGPDGGLVCGHCGKQLGNEAKSEKRKTEKNGVKGSNKRRRNMQSERLDGVVRRGAKSLVQHCLDTVVKHHDDIESFENMPDHLILAICKLFTKERVMSSTLFPLFLRPENTRVIVYDCSSLRTEDYKQIFAIVQSLRLLVLHNAYQFKDESMDYMMEKALHLVDIRLYAANLVTNEKWSQFFRSRGFNIHTLKLRWMDAAFEDQQVTDLVKYCPNLTRLKLENIWKIGPNSIKTISKLKSLEHLSLSMIQPERIPNSVLLSLIKTIGPNLRTLSLRGFSNLDDSVLSQIHSSCRNLTKLRITLTTDTTDEGFASLFTNWANPPLHNIDLSSNRDIDNQNPDGPEDQPIGLGAEGFAALMHHSGIKLRRLDISACRHIQLQTLLDVFVEPGVSFPRLERVDMSFMRDVDDVVLAGLFRAAAGSLKRVELFGCFSVGTGVVIPSGVVIVGAPRLELLDGGMELYGAGVEVHGMGAEEWENEIPESIRREMEDELDAMIVDE